MEIPHSHQKAPVYFQDGLVSNRHSELRPANMFTLRRQLWTDRRAKDLKKSSGFRRRFETET